MKIIMTSLVLAGLSSSVFAANPKPSSSTLTSALEVLSLPLENRRMVVRDQSEKFYSTFVGLAFNEKQPMSLRWKALMAVADAKGEKATNDLLRAGNHSLWFMRNGALVALKEVNPAAGAELAQKLVKDKALVVRTAAVDLLENDKSPEVRELLWSELNQNYNFKNKQSLWIRSKIVQALAKAPADKELKTFAALLSDSDRRLHVPAVRGLEKLTGVQLGEGKVNQAKLVQLWKDYLNKEQVEF